VRLISLGVFLSFEELQKSEEQFRGYFESALVGFAITSLEKDWIYANNQFFLFMKMVIFEHDYTDARIIRINF
jgi:hypothetical protein